MRARLLTLGWLVLVALPACGPSAQSADCKRLISCANALRDGSGDAAYGALYGEDGKCWLSDNAASACTETCKALVEGLAKRPGASAACK